MVPQNKVSLKILWKKSIDHNFNALTIGRRNKLVDVDIFFLLS